MNEIRTDEVDQGAISQMARYLASSGVEGEMPEWYRVFILAAKVNAPVWEVERALSNHGDALTPKREWLIRGLMLQFAEAEAAQRTFERSRARSDMRIIRPA